MTTHRFTVERIDVTTKGSFEQATAAFEENVPTADMTMLTRLVEAQASAGEIQAAVARAQGDLEFMIFAKLVQGSLTACKRSKAVREGKESTERVLGASFPIACRSRRNREPSWPAINALIGRNCRSVHLALRRAGRRRVG
jgi:hypothetical protein